MNVEILRIIGGLGYRVSPKMIYFFLVYQKEYPKMGNPFKFHVQDEQTYCLYWRSLDEPETAPSKLNDFKN